MYHSGCPGVNDTVKCELEMNVSELQVNTSKSNSSEDDGPTMLTRFVLETVISMPLSFLGLIGNALAIMVLLRQKPHLTTSIHLMAIAVADSLVLISSILLRSIRYIPYYTGYLSSYLLAYHYIFLSVYPSLYFVRLAGTWMVVLLTVDRYIAVCHPLKAQSSCTLSKTRRNILLLLLISALFSLPRYFEHRLDYSSDFNFSQTELTGSKVYTVVYRVFLYHIVMYICPMCILVVLNTLLLVALRRAEEQRNSISGTPLKRSQGRSVTAIVVIVVTLCIVSNTVALTTHLLWSLQLCFKSMAHLETPRRYTSLVSNVLVTFNCAVNFLIYVFCSKSFRVIFMRTCCYKRDCGYKSTNGTFIRMGTTRTDISRRPSGRKDTKLLNNDSPVML